MRDRRAFLTFVSAGVATGLAGCTGDGSSTEQSSPEPESETEPETTRATECDTTLTILSGAMEPNIPQDSEVCIVEYESYQPVEDPEKTGIITVEVGEEIGYEHLGGSGDVITYYRDGNEDSRPTTARAVSWEDGSYITKSDGNPDPYPDPVPVSSIIGVVTRVIDEPNESESEPESETETENNRLCELGPVRIFEEFVEALQSGNTERVNELSHPRSRTYQDLEPRDLSIETIEQVSEEEATTGSQTAAEVDINGVEEVFADDMAEEVQWLVVTFAESDGKFYVAMLKYEECWYYYEGTRD